MKSKKMSRKYAAIIKLGNNPDGSAKCLKYRFDNLTKFIKFLDQKWPHWLWFNLYSNKGTDKGTQIGNYTKYKRP